MGSWRAASTRGEWSTRCARPSSPDSSWQARRWSRPRSRNELGVSRGPDPQRLPGARTPRGWSRPPAAAARWSAGSTSTSSSTCSRCASSSRPSRPPAASRPAPAPRRVCLVYAELESARGVSNERLAELDIAFHRALVAYGGSRSLLQAWLALAPVILTVLVVANRRAELDQYELHTYLEGIHTPIVDALVREDERRAARRARACTSCRPTTTGAPR